MIDRLSCKYGLSPANYKDFTPINIGFDSPKKTNANSNTFEISLKKNDL